MEELLVSSHLTNKKCSNNLAHVQVKNLSASWSYDKSMCVLENVSFEVNQVHSGMINIIIIDFMLVF